MKLPESTFMKKGCFVHILILAILTLNSCEKEKGVVLPIQIKTNKVDYFKVETIKVEVKNVSDSVARYYKCSSVEGIPFNIDRLEDKSWNAYWGPICDGYNSFCCLCKQKMIMY